MRIAARLIPVGEGRWRVEIDGGAILLERSLRPRVEAARALLAAGASPMTELVLVDGEAIIASDRLGVIGGFPVVCADVDVMERD